MQEAGASGEIVIFQASPRKSSAQGFPALPILIRLCGLRLVRIFVPKEDAKLGNSTTAVSNQTKKALRRDAETQRRRVHAFQICYH